MSPACSKSPLRHARAAGMPITLPPGSAFNADLGTGYDAVLVTKYAARCPDDGAR